jgi:hypothetical protein
LNQKNEETAVCIVEIKKGREYALEYRKNRRRFIRVIFDREQLEEGMFERVLEVQKSHLEDVLGDSEFLQKLEEEQGCKLSTEEATQIYADQVRHAVRRNVDYYQARLPSIMQQINYPAAS